ncbi:MAG: Hpt domain-containing protein [Pseudomonadota bacterium]
MFEWLTGSQNPAPNALDEAYLLRLRRHVGADAMGELIDDGVLELSGKLDHLAEQASSDDIKHIASVCHDIAGAAGNLGLTAMTRAAVESNRMALSDTPPSAGELVAHVISCRAPAEDALAAFRADQNAPGTASDAQDDSIAAPAPEHATTPADAT